MTEKVHVRLRAALSRGDRDAELTRGMEAAWNLLSESRKLPSH